MADEIKNDTKTDDTFKPSASVPAKNDSDQGKNESEKTEAEKANEEARAAEVKAVEAQAKADEESRSEAQRKADKAAQDADDARAKAEAARLDENGNVEPMSAAEAKVTAPVPADTPASSHLAHKIGRDPANPKPIDDLSGDPDVRLTRVTPDRPDGPVEIMVHEVMVGDYLRAGWSRG